MEKESGILFSDLLGSLPAWTVLVTRSLASKWDFSFAHHWDSLLRVPLLFPITTKWTTDSPFRQGLPNQTSSLQMSLTLSSCVWTWLCLWILSHSTIHTVLVSSYVLYAPSFWSVGFGLPHSAGEWRLWVSQILGEPGTSFTTHRVCCSFRFLKIQLIFKFHICVLYLNYLSLPLLSSTPNPSQPHGPIFFHCSCYNVCV